MVAREETHRSAENRDVNWGPLSETMCLGIRCSWKTCWVSRAPVSAAEGNLGRGTTCAALENLTTIVSITVCPCEGAKPVMKSRAM